MKNIVIDIGASSFRVMLCDYDGKTLSLSECARDKTPTVYSGGFLRWDMSKMGEAIVSAVRSLLSLHDDIDSVGICSFGVDYVYLDGDGKLVDEPISYRDEGNAKYAKMALQTLDQRTIYGHTGIQFLPFNTAFQLYRDKLIGRHGQRMLLISDYIAYLLCGESTNELTGLSTGALLDKDTLKPSKAILDGLGIDGSIFQRIVRPGETIGWVSGDILPPGSNRRVPVIAVNSHDTSSAVTALHIHGGSTAFLSCGSWALFGVKSDNFDVGDEAMEANFTNELMDDGVCFLKNINGMYLINQIYKAMKDIDASLRFPSSVSSFSKEDDTDVLLDVNDPLFANPIGILGKLHDYLEKTGQRRGDLTFVKLLNSFYRSLCLAVREEKEKLEAITGQRIERICLVGGASAVPVVVDYLASALGCEVLIGPKEATAMGNAMLQISALTGERMDSLREKASDGMAGKPPNAGLMKRFDDDYMRLRRLMEEKA